MKKWISVFMVLSLSIILFACGGKTENAVESNTSGKKNQLVVVDWGGDYTDAKKGIIKRFEEKFNAEVLLVTPTDYGKLKAMVDSGNVEWDVVNMEGAITAGLGKKGYLEKLDYNVINTEGIPEEVKDDYSIAIDFMSIVISYNTDQFPSGKHPKNWAEFWDYSKFPGDRTLWKHPVGLLESALLADGVKPEELYPLDIDRAFASLDKIKDHIKVWFETGAQPPQMLATNDVALAAGWSGRITTAKGEGAPVDLEYNQGIILDDRLVVPKGAPNKELAMEFINFSLQPEEQADFSSNIDYAPANSKALELLPEEVVERLGQNPENAKNQIFSNNDWWRENLEEVDERLHQWLLE